jgi:hypothetical protein
MNEVQIFTVTLPEVGFSPPKTKWEREHQAFQRLLPDLLKTLKGKYVVIHEGQVIDSGEDEIPLAERFFEKYGNISPHIGLVAESPPIIRMPHYREVRREEVVS